MDQCKSDGYVIGLVKFEEYIDARPVSSICHHAHLRITSHEHYVLYSRGTTDGYEHCCYLLMIMKWFLLHHGLKRKSNMHTCLFPECFINTQSLVQYNKSETTTVWEKSGALTNKNNKNCDGNINELQKTSSGDGSFDNDDEAEDDNHFDDCTLEDEDDGSSLRMGISTLTQRLFKKYIVKMGKELILFTTWRKLKIIGLDLLLLKF